MYDRGSVFLLVGEEGGFEEGEGIFFFACWAWAWAFLLVWRWERGGSRGGWLCLGVGELEKKRGICMSLAFFFSYFGLALLCFAAWCMHA